MYNTKLEKLASEISQPCVTISLNTHRTHPDNTQDIINLKNSLKEARDKVIANYSTHNTDSLLKKIEAIASEINCEYNLDSLHIFLSNSTKEIIKSPFSIKENFINISESFAVKPLIKTINRTEEYYIMVLSQSSVSLFHALNETIIDEIKSEDFPVTKNLHQLSHHDKANDAKHNDDLAREFLNKLDKSFLKVYNDKPLNCIVVCASDIYSRLVQVSDRSNVYQGHVILNHNDSSKHQIVADAWAVIKVAQKQRRSDNINEMKEAVGKGKVITDLAEIFTAAKEGRGELLITNDNYNQQVKMTGERSFEILNETNHSEGLDIVSEIAWEVVSKNGKAIFTTQDDLNAFGNIALMVRY